MPDSASGLHIHLAEISMLGKLIQQGEQPFVVLEENILPHDKHVAESCSMAIQHRISIRFVIRMTRAQNVVHVTQILEAKMPIRIPMLLEIRKPTNTTGVIKRRGDNVPSIYHFGDIAIVDTVFLNGLTVDIGIDDFAIVVFLMRGIGEIEVASVVAETVVVGILVFPSPVLRGQLAVTGIFAGNILTLIIMQSIVESLCSLGCSNLHREDAVSFRENSSLVCRHEDFDIRMLMFSCESHVRYSALLKQTSFPQ